MLTPEEQAALEICFKVAEIPSVMDGEPLTLGQRLMLLVRRVPGVQEALNAPSSPSPPEPLRPGTCHIVAGQSDLPACRRKSINMRRIPYGTTPTEQPNDCEDCLKILRRQ